MSWEEKWSEETKKDYWHRPDPRLLTLIAEWKAMGFRHAADIGCGIGRHTIALAEAGFSVTALDNSKTALEHIKEIRAKRNLDISLVEGNYLDRLLTSKGYDVIISYNAIYHGTFQDFKRAVRLIRSYLRPVGYFFMTCPTREDGKYGNGREIASHTYEPMNSLHPGDVHYFADKHDLDQLLMGFEIIDRGREEHYWDNEGMRQFSSYWQVLARKK